MYKNHLLTSIYVLTLLAVLSCTDNEPEPSINDLSEFAHEFMTMRLGSPNTMNRASESAINQSFQSMMSNRGFTSGRISDDSTGNGGDGKDSTIYEDPWISCAVITTLENEDGSTTVTYDYGDGCEEGWGEYKYLMFGRTEQTYKYTSQKAGSAYNDNYLFKMLYDNYGGGYEEDSSRWTMNGNSSYEGSSSYDTLQQKFSGAYTYSDTSLNTYGGKSYDYKSRGRAMYDEKGWVVEENDYEYKEGPDYYKSRVVERLVSDYSCNSFSDNREVEIYIWAPVSGREAISYKQGDKEGSFEIDYGNGSCDNIIYITENGKRVRVDLGAGWVTVNKEG